jgi:hypothetical protein
MVKECRLTYPIKAGLEMVTVGVAVLVKNLQEAKEASLAPSVTKAIKFTMRVALVPQAPVMAVRGGHQRVRRLKGPESPVILAKVFDFTKDFLIRV